MLSLEEAFNSMKAAASEGTKSSSMRAAMAMMGDSDKAVKVVAFSAWTRAQKMVLKGVCAETQKFAQEALVSVGQLELKVWEQKTKFEESSKFAKERAAMLMTINTHAALLTSVFAAWLRAGKMDVQEELSRERRTSNAFAEAAKAAGMAAAMSLMGRSDEALITGAFGAWVQAHKSSIREALSAYRAQVREAEKAAKMKAAMTLFSNCNTVLQSTTFSAWVRVYELARGEATAKKQAEALGAVQAELQKKAAAMMLGNCDSGLLSCCFYGWLRVLRLAKDAALAAALAAGEAARAAALKSAARLMVHGDSGIVATAFGGWMRAHEKFVQEKMAASYSKNKEMILEVAAAAGSFGGGDSSILPLIFSAWLRALKISASDALQAAQEAALSAKLEKSQASLKLLLGSSTAVLGSTFSAWQRAMRMSMQEEMATAQATNKEASASVSELKAKLGETESHLLKLEKEMRMHRAQERNFEKMRSEFGEVNARAEALNLSKLKAHKLLQDIADGKMNAYRGERYRQILLNPDSYAILGASRLLSNSATSTPRGSFGRPQPAQSSQKERARSNSGLLGTFSSEDTKKLVTALDLQSINRSASGSSFPGSPAHSQRDSLPASSAVSPIMGERLPNL